MRVRPIPDDGNINLDERDYNEFQVPLSQEKEPKEVIVTFSTILFERKDDQRKSHLYPQERKKERAKGEVIDDEDKELNTNDEKSLETDSKRNNGK
ncbi:hypothetical protein CHS0354_021684 [Potamilus streckersoni]|uniref:Uncharacterized protein n=1 Tax=Potamilus streckersoni TaxID=2493646 RepID=A0AAE0TKF7_9BIVA|nr:hypothetical protein CHS0354_021684 [Potamilus streckersoni]